MSQHAPSPARRAAALAVSADTGAPDRSIEESCKRALHHFPSPDVAFPMPALEFDFRIAVRLNAEPSRVETRAKEITTVYAGRWSGSFGNRRVMVRTGSRRRTLGLTTARRLADMISAKPEASGPSASSKAPSSCRQQTSRPPCRSIPAHASRHAVLTVKGLADSRCAHEGPSSAPAPFSTCC